MLLPFLDFEDRERERETRDERNNIMIEKKTKTKKKERKWVGPLSMFSSCQNGSIRQHDEKY